MAGHLARCARGRPTASSTLTRRRRAPGASTRPGACGTRPASRAPRKPSAGQSRSARVAAGRYRSVDVVAHHAVGADERAQRAQGGLHPPHPPAGHRSPRPSWNSGHDLGLEQLEEAVGLELGAPVLVGLVLGRGDGPPVGPGRPGGSTRPTSRRGSSSCRAPLSTAFMPLVPHASMGPARGVEPDVAALDQGTGRRRCRSPRGTRSGGGRRGRAANADDLADQLLARRRRPGGPCRRR